MFSLIIFTLSIQTMFRLTRLAQARCSNSIQSLQIKYPLPSSRIYNGINRSFFSRSDGPSGNYSSEKSDLQNYIILWGYNTTTLSSCVDSYLKNGWKIIGRPHHVNEYYGGNVRYFYQAVIKDKKLVAKAS